MRFLLETIGRCATLLCLPLSRGLTVALICSPLLLINNASAAFEPTLVQGEVEDTLAATGQAAIDDFIEYAAFMGIEEKDITEAMWLGRFSPAPDDIAKVFDAVALSTMRDMGLTVKPNVAFFNQGNIREMGAVFGINTEGSNMAKNSSAIKREKNRRIEAGWIKRFGTLPDEFLDFLTEKERGFMDRDAAKQAIALPIEIVNDLSGNPDAVQEYERIRQEVYLPLLTARLNGDVTVTEAKPLKNSAGASGSGHSDVAARNKGKEQRHQRILDFAQKHNLKKNRTGFKNPLSDEQVQILAMGFQCEIGSRQEQENCIVNRARQRNALPGVMREEEDQNRIVWYLYEIMMEEIPILRDGNLNAWTDERGRLISKKYGYDSNVYGALSNMEGKGFFCPDEPKIQFYVRPNWLTDKERFILKLSSALSDAGGRSGIVCAESRKPITITVSIIYEEQLITEFTVLEQAEYLETSPGYDGNWAFTKSYIAHEKGSIIWDRLMAAKEAADEPAASTNQNPFRNPDGLNGRDHSKSDLVYIYDGKFQKVPLPMEGGKFQNAYLRSIVVDFFSGLSPYRSLDNCYPTGSVQVPWILESYKQDAYGNKYDVRKKNLTSTMAPEVVPTFHAQKEEELYSSRDVGPAVVSLVSKFGCDSIEFRHLYSQVLSLNDGLLNGFKPLESGESGIQREHILKRVNMFLDLFPAPKISDYQNGVCQAYVSKDFYEDAEAYVKWAKLPASKNEELDKALKRECPGWRAGSGTYREPIVELIKDLRRDVKL